MEQSTPLGSLVLMYHRMGIPLVRSIVRGQYVMPVSLRRQVTQLSSAGYSSLPLRDMLSSPEGFTGHFSMTFDDGYASVMRLAYPVLARLQTPATIFMVADAIGKTNEWDVRIGDRTEKMLALPDLRELAGAGFEIGSHTMNHAHLTELSDADLKSELVDSRKLLEDLLGQSVTGFAYPYGEWDERVRAAVIDAGYDYAVITTRGAVTREMDVFAIPRINVRWNTFGRLLDRKVASAQRISGYT